MLVLSVLFGSGIASALLLNDTLAIVGTPVVLLLARKHGIAPKVLLLALAFAITIGGAMSPIGNPQNLLIASNGNIANPFFTFAMFLLVPTAINLFLAYMLLKFFYKEEFHKRVLNHSRGRIKDQKLAGLARISLALILVLVIANIALVSFDRDSDFKPAHIALIAALPIVIASPKRFSVVRTIDWHTLVFFASMFVLTESAWETGFFQSVLNSQIPDITSAGTILVVSVILSQLVSNVPLVALYLPVLLHGGASTKELMALAAGSTIAGNMLILGAASNVIIIQNAEKKGETLTFMEFAKIGIPLTVLNVAVYWLFLPMP